MIMGCKLYLANYYIFLAQFQLSDILLSLYASKQSYQLCFFRRLSGATVSLLCSGFSLLLQLACVTKYENPRGV